MKKFGEIFASWFSDSRSLPLNDKGRVDCSFDKKIAEEPLIKPNPEAAERFLGRMFNQISLLDGGRIIQLYRWNEKDPELPIEHANCNVFRLDRSGNVVWQVVRNERGHMRWDELHELAKRRHAEGALEGYYTEHGFVDPFWNLSMDESQAQNPEPAGVYRPDCKVYLNTRWWIYELDVEKGVATCTGDQMK